MEKKFSLPGWYAHCVPMIKFLKYYNQHKEQFYPDRIIDSTYDAFGITPMLWTGGRIPKINNKQIFMEDILKEYTDNYPDIKLRHVFTNCLIDYDPSIITDFMCNQFVKKYFRPQDEVIINHPKLIQHFKEHYPKINIIYSTTLDIIDLDKVNEITKNNIYVINYNFNNNDYYLDNLKHKENIELICAEPCVPNCPVRTKHYKAISEMVLNIFEEPENYVDCPYGSTNRTFAEMLKLPHAITNERVDELAKKGFQYFKISGRCATIPIWLESIVYYLALPKYREEVRQILLSSLW